MKTFGKMSFGFSTVATGVRAAVYQPELIATSTVGGFRITPPVSKALLLQSGDYIMFINNVNDIDECINKRIPELVEFCSEKGLDIDSAEARTAIHTEFDQWGIAKGIAEFDKNGTAKTMRERMTDADKKAYTEAHFEEMFEAAKNSDDKELVDAISREDITKEEIVLLLAKSVQGAVVTKYKGAKGANPSGITGIGTSLNFADSNVWNMFKEGSEDKKTNKIYSVDIDNLIDVPVHNGFEVVTVKAALLGDYRFEAPQRNGKKEEAEETAE